MRKTATCTACLVVSLLATTHTPAQNRRVVPPSATWTDASDNSYYPFIYLGGSRTQHLIDGSALSGGAAVIQQWAYRRDAKDQTPFAARTIPNFTVTIGYSQSTAAAMSTTFASNRSGNQTVVFAGTYNLPAQPVVPDVGPWNIVFKPSVPFVYVPAQGNLLLEFDETGTATTRVVYLCDSVRSNAASGWTGGFGSNGAFASQETYTVTCPTPATLKAGGAATIEAIGLAKNYPAAAIFGFSATLYGALVLPFDLTPLGAPGNKAYVSLDLILPLVLTGGKGSASLPIPNVSGLDAVSLFGQALFLDAASNSFGSVWSSGVSMLLAGNVPMQMLVAASSTATTGSLLYGTGTGGNVVQIN
jgi:hypothetical protein